MTRRRHAPDDKRLLALRCIRALVATLRRSARIVERKTGLTNAQLFALHELAREDGLSMSTLAERLHALPNALSPLIARLEQRRLVNRATAEDDRRRAVLRLTARGRSVVRRAPEPPTVELIRALETLPARDLDGLTTGLTAVLGALHEDWGKAPILFEDEPSPAGGKRPPAKPSTGPRPGR